jgi:hypothetical protein
LIGSLAAEQDSEGQNGGKTQLHPGIKAGTGARASRFEIKEAP